MRRVRAIGLALVLLTVAESVCAQAPAELIARGTRAYDSLDFDRAAGWLTRVLSSPYLEDLSTDQRVRALIYLAATERYRGHTDSAEALFRHLLLLDPRAHPDPLIFPPEVSQLFEAVRLRTKIVGLQVPRDTTFLPGKGELRFRVRTSSPIDARVALVHADGRLLRTLYVGPVSDSLDLGWDGRDSSGARVGDGHQYLSAAITSDATTSCQARVALTLASARIDTLPIPLPLDPKELAPERATEATGISGFAAGAAIAAAVLLLPELTGASGGPSATRQVAAGSFAVGGLVALILQRPGRPLPGAVAANAARRAAWQRRVAAVERTNVTRMTQAPLRIGTGPVSRSGCEVP